MHPIQARSGQRYPGRWRDADVSGTRSGAGVLAGRAAWRHNWAMDHDRGGEGGEAGGPPGAADAEARLAGQAMLAEYAALRAEVDRRASTQWNVLALQITSTGLIASLALSRASDVALLLVIPLSSYMLGSRYILHDYHLKLISRYIRDSLSGRLHGQLAWDSWKSSQMASDGRAGHWLSPVAWNLLHPTRLAFEGVAWLALLTAALAAAYTWWHKVPGWGLVLGFALLWILGVLATYFLHRSFNRSTGT